MGEFRKLIVKAARNVGFTDLEILKLAVEGRPALERRAIVATWAPDLGLTPDEALDIARRAALIRK